MKFIFIYLYLSEKAMAPHSSTLAWKIPRTEEPGGLQSMGSLRVGHDWATSFSLFTFMHWRRKWQPTPMFSPGESQGWGSLVGCRLWVTQSRTRLKWLSNLYLCDFFHQLFSDYDNFILSGISVYIYYSIFSLCILFSLFFWFSLIFFSLFADMFSLFPSSFFLPLWVFSNFLFSTFVYAFFPCFPSFFNFLHFFLNLLWFKLSIPVLLNKNYGLCQLIHIYLRKYCIFPSCRSLIFIPEFLWSKRVLGFCS